MGWAVVLALSVCAAHAQGPGQLPPKRTILQHVDVAPAPAQETIFGTVEIAPDSGNGFHTHNGSEIGYVLRGHVRLLAKGEADRKLVPGDSFMVPRGIVHRSVLAGEEPATLINTWTVDKGDPLLAPAPDP
jgi:quercetin dioxygenase-like cupin family protein